MFDRVFGCASTLLHLVGPCWLCFFFFFPMNFSESIIAWPVDVIRLNAKIIVIIAVSFGMACVIVGKQACEIVIRA